MIPKLKMFLSVPSNHRCQEYTVYELHKRESTFCLPDYILTDLAQIELVEKVTCGSQL